MRRLFLIFGATLTLNSSFAGEASGSHGEVQVEEHSVLSDDGQKRELPEEAALDTKADADMFAEKWASAGLTLGKLGLLKESSLKCHVSSLLRSSNAKPEPSICTLIYKKTGAEFTLKGSEADAIVAMLEKAKVSKLPSTNTSKGSDYEIGNLKCPNGWKYLGQMLVPDPVNTRRCIFKDFRGMTK